MALIVGYMYDMNKQVQPPSGERDNRRLQVLNHLRFGTFMTQQGKQILNINYVSISQSKEDSIFARRE